MIVHAAIKRLETQHFEDCIVRFETVNVNLHDGNTESVWEGVNIFASFNGTAFFDTSYWRTDKKITPDGYPISQPKFFQQYYYRQGEVPIRTSYELDGHRKNKAFFNASLDLRNRVRARTYLLNNLGLGILLDRFAPQKESLRNLTIPGRDFRTTKTGDRLTAVMDTARGRVEIVVMRHGEYYELVSARSTQGPDHIYGGNGTGEQKLSEIRKYDDTELNGFLSVVNELTLTYGSLSIPATITHIRTMKSEAKTWSSKSTLKVTEYRKITDASEIDKLRVPIPNGSRVTTSDPDLKDVELVYLDGEVVRKLDGAAIETVIYERAVRRRYYWIGGAAAIVLAVGYWLRKRYWRARAA